MATIKKKSSILIIITVLLLFSLSSGGLYTFLLTKTVEPDAEMINKLGVIRGSLQRLIKLETNSISDNRIIEKIDNTFMEFQTESIKIYDNKGHVQEDLDNLKNSWIQTKDILYEFRRDPSKENRRLILQKSEELWEQSNNAVLTSQLISERKMDNYTNSFILIILNLGLAILVILLIKRYVKDTLEYLVRHDTLTNSYNRDFFYDFLSKEISRSKRHDRNLSIIMLDIDRFKRVNDTYGHDVGDSVLEELSSIIKSNIRESDVFARLGGEEFGIIIPETNSDDALNLAEKIRHLIEKNTFKGAGKITISLGVTQYVKDDTPNCMYKRADVALYKAKRTGRNRSEVEL